MTSVKAPIGAILLGNPSHVGRRALLLTDEKNPRVFKIGVGSIACGLVAGERKFLLDHGARSSLIPDVVMDGSGENWEAFGIPYLEQSAKVTLGEISSLLSGWLENEARPVGEISDWKRVMESSHQAAKSISEACRNLLLKPSMVHGDLAPWNVRRSSTDDLLFIDWEESRVGGIPCWDALHFEFQQAALVKRLPSLEIGVEIEKAMKEKELARLIELSGWAGYEDLLFGSYLLAMATEEEHRSALLGPNGYQKQRIAA